MYLLRPGLLEKLVKLSFDGCLWLQCFARAM
jgi:hypothetical protein